MIRVDMKGWSQDLIVLAFFFLLAAGVSHHFNRAHGDTCGNSSHAAVAQPR